MQACVNVSHSCQTGSGSIEVLQGPFYKRNSSGVILGVQFNNIFLKCPDDPKRSQSVTRTCVYARAKEKLFIAGVLFIE